MKKTVESSFPSKVTKATRDFSRRLAVRDPKLLRKLMEIRNEKFMSAIPQGDFQQKWNEVTQESEV